MRSSASPRRRSRPKPPSADATADLWLRVSGLGGGLCHRQTLRLRPPPLTLRRAPAVWLPVSPLAPLLLLTTSSAFAGRYQRTLYRFSVLRASGGFAVFSFSAPLRSADALEKLRERKIRRVMLEMWRFCVILVVLYIKNIIFAVLILNQFHYES